MQQQSLNNRLIAEINNGYHFIVNHDYSTSIETGIKFLTAHVGCLSAPFVTSAILGANTSGATDYLVSLTIGTATMLSMDAMVQNVKIEECMNCVNSKLNGFRRQGKIIAQAVLMSSAFYFGHSLSGHHHSINEIQATKSGRRFIAREGALCGYDNKKSVDTIWIDQPKRKNQ